MAHIPRYKTFADFPNETGFNQLAYPVRDAILIVSPFFVMLLGIFVVFSIGSYYSFASFVGRTRYFNSFLASGYVTTIISFFFSLAGWVTPLHVLTWIGITALFFALTIFYKE